jgi:hypothetical protein
LAKDRSLGIKDEDYCVMLLPDSSDNMTTIINYLAKLGKDDNTIFNQIGHWFNGVFGNRDG